MLNERLTAEIPMLQSAFSALISLLMVPTVLTTAENAAFADFVGRGEKKQFPKMSVSTVNTVSSSRKQVGISYVAFAKVATSYFAKFQLLFTKQ